MSKMQDIQDWLRKYLFWCLCGLIAIFSLASWWLGVGTLNTKSKENISKIEGKFSAAQAVMAVAEIGIHPNEAVNKQLGTLTVGRHKTVLTTWKELYKRQKETIFKWPTLLDKEFLTWINSNPPNSEIPPDQLAEYQYKVVKELERIVTQVAHAEWPDNAAPAAASSSLGGVGSEMRSSGTASTSTIPTSGPGISEKLLWDPADITAYKNRYTWRIRPSTTEVRLAQEDLWVLEQLCQVITTVNGKIPPYQRPIKVVKKIAIEGFALDGQPKGINSKRLLRIDGAAGTPVASGEGGEAAVAPAAGEAPTGEAAVPISAPPPRLGSAFHSGGHGGGEGAASGGEGAAAEGEGAAAAKKPDDDLYNWRYVNQAGYPLSKAQLDGEHKDDQYRMIPFKMQMHILQSSLPKLLETIKNSPLIMEVTQIRINADNNAANQFAGMVKSTGGDTGAAGPTFNNTASAGLLTGEIVLEIHGAAYLAQPYDEKKLPPPEAAPGGDL